MPWVRLPYLRLSAGRGSAIGAGSLTISNGLTSSLNAMAAANNQNHHCEKMSRTLPSTPYGTYSACAIYAVNPISRTPDVSGTGRHLIG